MGHVILKQLIEITTEGVGEIFSLQQRISDLYYHEILPTLDRSFDSVSVNETVHSFDQIVIDLGSISLVDLYNEDRIRYLLFLISRQVSEQLSTTHGSDHDSPSLTYSLTSRAFDNWLFYMKSGYRRWNVSVDTKQWEQQILTSAATEQKSIDALRELILTDRNALSRIVFQYSGEFKAHIVEALTACEQSQLETRIQELQKTLTCLAEKSNDLRALAVSHITLWKEVLRVAAGQRDERFSTTRLGLQVLHNFMPNSFLLSMTSISSNEDTGDASLAILMEELQSLDLKTITLTETGPTADDKISALIENSSDAPDIFDTELDTPEEHPVGTAPIKQEALSSEKALAPDISERFSVADELYVQNAGIVLLHPFITSLFTFTSTITDGKFNDAACRNKALLLLHFLTSGSADCDEHNLVISKMLCGIPLVHPIDTSVELSDHDKASAEDLLQEAISHWSILKNTTPNGLRESFLQRPGKYFQRGNNHYVHVQNSSIDVLLDHLPWGLAMVKLPWMKFILNIEWR